MSEEKINSDETGSSDEINSANPPVIPPKKSIFAKLIKWVFIFFLLLFLLITGIFIFIQTDTFNKIALDIVLDKVNTSLKDKDSEIYGNNDYLLLMISPIGAFLIGLGHFINRKLSKICKAKSCDC